MDFLDLLLDALIDCAKLIPFLLATVFLMEYLEHRAADRFVSAIRRAGRFGPLVGAGLGIVPQCGFSAAVAHLFNGGLVSAGTLAAVFLSTSDEALPILIATPSGLPAVWRLIVTKLIVAILFGFLLDLLWPISRQQAEYIETEREHVCESDSKLLHIFLAALKRTASILFFLFVITLVLNLLIAAIGEEKLASLLLPGPFQPFLAGLIGLIPNCAASVLLTRLYLDGMIPFGSAVAGLCSASGIGMLVLLKGRRKPKTYLILIAFVYASAVLVGSLLCLFGA